MVKKLKFQHIKYDRKHTMLTFYCHESDAQILAFKICAFYHVKK